MSGYTKGWCAALALACSLVWAGCKGRGTTRSPEKLRETYLQALERDDPDAVYELLTPQAQSQISKEAFRARWKAQQAEREATLEAAKARTEAQSRAIQAGTTVHANGAVLEWVQVDGRYRIVSGLPSVASTATPASALRAFIAAIRSADLTALESILASGLRERLRADWQARAAAIEKALEDPSAIELSADNARAELRYEQNRAVTLEQTPLGWRITALE